MCQFLRRKQATQGSSHYVRLLLSYLLWRMSCRQRTRGSPDTQRGDSYYPCSGPRPDTSLHITSQNNAKQPPLLFLLPDLRTSRRQVHSAPWLRQGAYGDFALSVGTGEVEVLLPNVSYVIVAEQALYQGGGVEYTSCADDPLSIPHHHHHFVFCLF